MSDQRPAEDFTTTTRDVAIRADDRTDTIDLDALRSLVRRALDANLPGDTPLIVSGLHTDGALRLRRDEHYAEHAYLRQESTDDNVGGGIPPRGRGVPR